MFSIIRSTFFSRSDEPLQVAQPQNKPANTTPAIGIVRLIIQSANIKKTSCRTPRPFVLVGLRSEPGLNRRTSVLKARTQTPNWMLESTDIIVYTTQDFLEFRVMNEHSIFKPGLVGLATFSLGVLNIEHSLVGMERFIQKNPDQEKLDPKGVLLFDLFYYPVISATGPEDIGNAIAIEKLVDSGIMSLQIQGTINFLCEEHLPMPRKLVAHVCMGWTTAPIYATHPAKLTSGIVIWDSSFDLICLRKSRTVVVIKLIDASRSSFSAYSPVYGHISLALDELLMTQDEKQSRMWPLSGCLQGALNLSAIWRAVDITSYGVSSR